MTALGTVFVTGSPRRPVLHARFDPHTPHPTKPEATLKDFIRALPDRRWEPDTRMWVIEATGLDPDGKFERAGFTVTFDDDVLWPSEHLNDYLTPAMHITRDRSAVLIRPRLLGYPRTIDTVGPSADWNKDTRVFRLPLLDVAGLARDREQAGLDPYFPQHVLDVARDVELDARASRDDHEAAGHVASAVSPTDVSEHTAELIAEHGDIPSWFGLDLYPYQRGGALAIAAGHTYDADEPGLGKTRTALAGAALLNPARTLIVGPPVSVTNWCRETATSRLNHTQISEGTGEIDERGGFHAGEAAYTPSDIVAIIPGRKQSDLPDTGVVVVADSTLAKRTALVDDLIAWNPDVLISDEIHREKTWHAQRTQALMRLAHDVPTVIGLSGTPMLQDNPEQLVSQLAITGHLDPIFGGKLAFLKRYCRRNFFNAWEANTARLPELGAVLARDVWVRRTKKDVLPDLPPKTRRLEWVDVDKHDYRQTHTEVLSEWADEAQDVFEETGYWPAGRERLLAITGEPFSALSPLRKAAGLAKVPAALDWIRTHMASDTAGERPLIVWVWHRDVAQALATELGPACEVILGGISTEKKDTIVDDFQAGNIPVLIASIAAANVAITLTASADVLFVETDWTPGMVSQAEDRACRIGQTRPVLVTTLAAADTLDEKMHESLARTGHHLDHVLTDGDNSVTEATDEDTKTATELVISLAERAIAGRKRKIANSA